MKKRITSYLNHILMFVTMRCYLSITSDWKEKRTLQQIVYPHRLHKIYNEAKRVKLHVTCRLPIATILKPVSWNKRHKPSHSPSWLELLKTSQFVIQHVRARCVLLSGDGYTLVSSPGVETGKHATPITNEYFLFYNRMYRPACAKQAFLDDSLVPRKKKKMIPLFN